MASDGIWTVTRRGILAFGMAVLLPVGAFAQTEPGKGWMIEADQARDLLASGALLFDVRSDKQRAAAPVEGAVPVAWPMFTQGQAPDKGKLLTDDAALTQVLRGLGVSGAQPVVVVGDSLNGWGEDGRIVWTLRSLGKADSFLVNGGAAALLSAGPVTATAAAPGDFTVTRTDAYAITKEALRADLGQPDLVILDAREPREFAGATPYGEARGGHVPGAQPLYFRDLMAPDGRALEGDALQARLTALGIGPDTTVVSYCTAGIRSGFVTAVLQSAGIDARNYSGSMWEWSAAPAAEYPLETQ